MSAKIYTIANQKGGIGKTTTALAFAFGLAHRGYRVLCIDTDQQSNLTDQLNVDKNETLTLYNIVTNRDSEKHSINDVICRGVCSLENLDLVASSQEIAFYEAEAHRYGDEKKIKSAIAVVKDDYDFVIIDTPPLLGKMMVAALYASDGVIIPTTPDTFSIDGFELLRDNIERIRQDNGNLVIKGIVLIKYRDSINLNKIMRGEIEQRAMDIGTKVFKRCVRESVAVREAQTLHEDMFTYAPSSTSVADYKEVIDEFLESEAQ